MLTILYPSKSFITLTFSNPYLYYIYLDFSFSKKFINIYALKNALNFFTTVGKYKIVLFQAKKQNEALF